jgi:hypothetical protein
VSDPPGEKLSAAGVLDRVIRFVDAPWKAIALVAFMIVGGAGYIIYSERARIADAVLDGVQSHARFDDDAFIADAPRLLRDVHADLAMLVSVNLRDNLLADRIGITSEGNRWVPTYAPQVALSEASHMPRLVAFLANETVCANAAESYNDDARELTKFGYVRICMIAVPPLLGVSLGGLIVAWKIAPTPSAEQRAHVVIRAAALKYADW